MVDLGALMGTPRSFLMLAALLAYDPSTANHSAASATPRLYRSCASSPSTSSTG